VGGGGGHRLGFVLGLDESQGSRNGGQCPGERQHGSSELLASCLRGLRVILPHPDRDHLAGVNRLRRCGPLAVPADSCACRSHVHPSLFVSRSGSAGRGLPGCSAFHSARTCRIASSEVGFGVAGFGWAFIHSSVSRACCSGVSLSAARFRRAAGQALAPRFCVPLVASLAPFPIRAANPRAAKARFVSAARPPWRRFVPFVLSTSHPFAHPSAKVAGLGHREGCYPVPLGRSYLLNCPASLLWPPNAPQSTCPPVRRLCPRWWFSHSGTAVLQTDYGFPPPPPVRRIRRPTRIHGMHGPDFPGTAPNLPHRREDPDSLHRIPRYSGGCQRGNGHRGNCRLARDDARRADDFFLDLRHRVRGRLLRKTHRLATGPVRRPVLPGTTNAAFASGPGAAQTSVLGRALPTLRRCPNWRKVGRGHRAALLMQQHHIEHNRARARRAVARLSRAEPAAGLRTRQAAVGEVQAQHHDGQQDPDHMDGVLQVDPARGLEIDGRIVGRRLLRKTRHRTRARRASAQPRARGSGHARGYPRRVGHVDIRPVGQPQHNRAWTRAQAIDLGRSRSGPSINSRHLQ